MMVLGQEKCVCGKGFNEDTYNGICYKCPDSCENCNSESSCAKCKVGFYLITASDQSQSCITACPKGFYPSETIKDSLYPTEKTKECLKCNVKCDSCSDSYTCTACQPGQVLTLYKLGDRCCQGCEDQCGSGTFKVSNTQCLSCASGCKKCSSATACETCYMKAVDSTTIIY